MKSMIIIATLFTTFSSYAFEYATYPIVKETWTCKDKENNYTLTAVVSEKSSTASLNADNKLDLKLDGDANLSRTSEKTNFKGGIEPGRDIYDYDVDLVRNTAEVFDEYSDKTSAKGQAVIFESGFVDCLGDFSEVHLLDCEISLERKEIKH